jgi:hypothetical protein
MGVNSVVSDPADKHKLHTFTRAVAVDMESHLVARVADAHGLAFAAVRVIIDPAHRAVPPAAVLAMAPGGSTDVSAMLWEILARPSQVSPLMRLAADAFAARAALVRLRPRWGQALAGNEKWVVANQAVAEPEPNKYADIAPPNSRDSMVVYGTFLENNSSNVCNLLKVVTSSTLSFQNRFLLDTTRTCSHSVIFFKSLQLRNLLSRPAPG